MRLGIDFGTCFSSAAFMDGETLTLIKDSASAGSSYSVPSSVFVTPQKQILVGKSANNRRLSDPTRYRRELKRDLGKRQPLLLGEQPYLSEVLITSILGKIKQDSDTFMTSLGQRVSTGAVLTIPATYQQPKRDLMRKAAAQAGFIEAEVTLLEEPVAAALYYAQKSKMSEGEILLVYDLGGGTFDATLLQKRGAGFEYLALPTGIERCGGVDFDRAIYNDLIREHPELQGLLQGERADKVALMMRINVGEMCVDLKHQLSELEEAEINFVVPELGDFVEYRLTRSAFNGMIAASIQETLTCCQQMLHQANITAEKISRILLVGGSCRIPYVQQMLQQQFKRPLVAAPDLELVVCQGAAQYAAIHKIFTVSPTPGEADYITISAAIKQAKPMSQIILRPGTYRESIILDREVELIGAGSTDKIIIESSTPIGVQMAIQQAKICGVTLQHTSAEASAWESAVAIAEGHLTLEDCIIRAQAHGITSWGEKSNVTLRRCHVHATKNDGILIGNGAKGVIEECDITECADTGIYVRGKGTTVNIRGSFVHDNNGQGISISAEGQVTIERSDIFANTGAGIQIDDKGSAASLRQSRIYDGKEKGIVVLQEAQITSEDCEIFANAHAGILVSDEASHITIKKSKIRNGKHIGVDIMEKGSAVLEECEVYGNNGAGIRVKDEGSEVSVSDCQIYEGAYVGIAILGRSHGILKNNHVHQNLGPGVRVSNAGSKATISECNIQNNGVGVVIEDAGVVSLVDSIVTKNKVDIYTEPVSPQTASEVRTAKIIQPLEPEMAKRLPSSDPRNPLVRTPTGHIASEVQTVKIVPPPGSETIKPLPSFDPKTLKVIRTLTGHTKYICSVEVSSDGQKLASGSADKTIRIWNLRTGQLLHTLSDHTDYVRVVAISRDGQMLVSSSDDKTIKLWNSHTGQLRRTLLDHTGYVMSVAVSPDGHTFASGSLDKTIKLWNLHTGQLLRTPIGHTDGVRAVAISPDGQTLVSGSADHTIKLWNLHTGQLLRTLTDHSNTVFSVAISPDGQTLVSGSADRTIKLWNLHTGQLFHTLTDHSNGVYAVAISLDGQVLVSGSRDHTIKLWNLHTSQLLRTLIGHTDEVYAVAISPNGQTLVSGSADKTIKVWRSGDA